MADPKVQIRITAKDETAATIQAVERKFTKLTDNIGHYAKFGLGLFAAGRLEQFLKQSMKAAAEADEQFAKSFKKIDDSVYNLQVNIGKAILGNGGVKWAFDQLIGTLNELAVAIQKPAEFGKYAWTKFIAGIKVDIGNLTWMLGDLFSNEGLQDRGAKMMQQGMHAGTVAQQGWDGTVGAAGGYTRPGAGGAAGGPGDSEWIGYAVERANQNLFGSLGANKKYAVDFMLPTVDDLEENLTKTLNQLGDRLPAILEEAQFFSDLHQMLAEQFAWTVGDAFASGFDQLFQSGSLEDGFRALAGTMLSGFGAAIQQFGEASLAFALLQSTLLKSLANLIPGGAIASAIAMIALGSALKAAGQAAFGNGVTRAGASNAANISTYSQGTGSDDRGVVVVELPRKGYVDPRDPFFQQFLVDTMALAQGRRLEFRET